MSVHTADSSESLPDIVNPVTGDRLWFVRLPAGPDESIVFECELPPRSGGTPLHIHTRTCERFECVRGELSMCVGGAGSQIVLRPGEHSEVPIGTAHRFWNATDASVRFRSTVTPGHEFERFLRSVYALGSAGRVGRDGMPRSVLSLAVLREYSDLYFVGPPVFLQRVVFGLLSFAAMLAGTRGRLAALVSGQSTRSRTQS